MASNDEIEEKIREIARTKLSKDEEKVFHDAFWTLRQYMPWGDDKILEFLGDLYDAATGYPDDW